MTQANDVDPAASVRTISVGKLEGAVYLDVVRLWATRRRALRSEEVKRVVARHTHNPNYAGLMNRLRQKGLIVQEGRHPHVLREPVVQGVVVMQGELRLWPREGEELPPRVPPTRRRAPAQRRSQLDEGAIPGAAQALLRKHVEKTGEKIICMREFSAIITSLHLSRTMRMRAVELLCAAGILARHGQGNRRQGYIFRICEPGEAVTASPSVEAPKSAARAPEAVSSPPADHLPAQQEPPKIPTQKEMMDLFDQRRKGLSEQVDQALRDICQLDTDVEAFDAKQAEERRLYLLDIEKKRLAIQGHTTEVEAKMSNLDALSRDVFNVFNLLHQVLRD